LPVVVEQAHRRKSRMVRQILPIQVGLILFITFCEDSSLIPGESGIALDPPGTSAAVTDD